MRQISKAREFANFAQKYIGKEDAFVPMTEEITKKSILSLIFQEDQAMEQVKNVPRDPQLEWVITGTRFSILELERAWA